MSSILDHQLSVRPRSVDVLPPKLHLGRLLQTVPCQIDARLRPATAVPKRRQQHVGDAMWKGRLSRIGSSLSLPLFSRSVQFWRWRYLATTNYSDNVGAPNKAYVPKIRQSAWAVVNLERMPIWSFRCSSWDDGTCYNMLTQCFGLQLFQNTNHLSPRFNLVGGILLTFHCLTQIPHLHKRHKTWHRQDFNIPTAHSAHRFFHLFTTLSHCASPAAFWCRRPRPIRSSSISSSIIFRPRAHLEVSQQHQQKGWTWTCKGWTQFKPLQRKTKGGLKQISGRKACTILSSNFSLEASQINTSESAHRWIWNQDSWRWIIYWYIVYIYIYIYISPLKLAWWT